jgi:alpha-1,6-mannosyltransferase
LVKIVDVCAFYAPQGGGVRTYVEQKLAAGPAFGHDIVILAPGTADRTERRGPGARIEWIESPRFPLDRKYRYFENVAAIHRRLDEERPDIVEASSPWRSAAAVADWGGTAPRALIMHADPMAAYAYRWLEGIASVAAVDRGLEWGWRYLRRLDRAFDTVVSASASLTARLTAGGLRGVVTQPMGIEPGLFSPALRDPALRARMLERCALPADATLLLGAGRHAPEKRWPMVVEAVMAVSFDRPVGLVLVGDGRDRARIVREIDGNPHIHLLSPIANRAALARLMASCDALIHGCEAETFSMVAAEAAASGLPQIVPDRGGACDHADAGGGLRFESGDAAAAARAIRSFIDSSCQTRPFAARTMERHFADLFAHYRSLASARRIAA